MGRLGCPFGRLGYFPLVLARQISGLAALIKHTGRYRLRREEFQQFQRAASDREFCNTLLILG